MNNLYKSLLPFLCSIFAIVLFLPPPAWAGVGQVCARGYITELVVNTKVDNYQGSYNTNISVRVDNTDFNTPDITAPADFLSIREKVGWVHIGLDSSVGSARNKERYATILAQLTSAHLSRLPVRIATRKDGSDKRCRQLEKEFEVVVCTEKAFCQY